MKARKTDQMSNLDAKSLCDFPANITFASRGSRTTNDADIIGPQHLQLSRQWWQEVTYSYVCAAQSKAGRSSLAVACLMAVRYWAAIESRIPSIRPQFCPRPITAALISFSSLRCGIVPSSTTLNFGIELDSKDS